MGIFAPDRAESRRKFRAPYLLSPQTSRTSWTRACHGYSGSAPPYLLSPSSRWSAAYPSRKRRAAGWREARQRLERDRAERAEPVPRDRAERLAVCQRRLVEDWQAQRVAKPGHQTRL